MSEQDRIFAKCAWRLIPFMGLLLLVNSIDRTHVGFAALTMNKDLGFSPTARLKVPMRRRGADCPVVVMKRGNARGAKGADHRR